MELKQAFYLLVIGICIQVAKVVVERHYSDAIAAAQKAGQGILKNWDFIDACFETIIGLLLIVLAVVLAFSTPRPTGVGVLVISILVSVGLRGTERGIRRFRSLIRFKRE